LKEIETGDDNLHANVRRHDKWLENEKAREIITQEIIIRARGREQDRQAGRNRVVVSMRAVFSGRQFSVGGSFSERQFDDGEPNETQGILIRSVKMQRSWTKCKIFCI
jgi:hypothetical protein